MSMSNEEYLEEIMYEAYQRGIYEQVRRVGSAIMEERPYLHTCDAFAVALRQLTEQKTEQITK